MEQRDRRRHRRPQRVLLVDDCHDLRELWRLWLTFWNFSVDDARNGQEAVRKAIVEIPDLIVMDLWMRGVNGVEALKRLNSDRRTAAVPVVAMSAQNSAPGELTVMAAGSDAFLPKPSDPDVLLDQIRIAMRRLPSVT